MCSSRSLEVVYGNNHDDDYDYCHGTLRFVSISTTVGNHLVLLHGGRLPMVLRLFEQLGKTMRYTFVGPALLELELKAEEQVRLKFERLDDLFLVAEFAAETLVIV